MGITDIRIFPVDEDRLRAHVSITIDNGFVIRDLKIIRGKDGCFVDMPHKVKNGERFEMASTVTMEARAMLEDEVFAEYARLTGETLMRRKLKA